MKAAKEERLEEENRSINLSIVPHTRTHSHTHTHAHTRTPIVSYVLLARSFGWFALFLFGFRARENPIDDPRFSLSLSRGRHTPHKHLPTYLLWRCCRRWVSFAATDSLVPYHNMRLGITTVSLGGGTTRSTPSARRWWGGVSARFGRSVGRSVSRSFSLCCYLLACGTTTIIILLLSSSFYHHSSIIIIIIIILLSSWDKELHPHHHRPINMVMDMVEEEAMVATAVTTTTTTTVTITTTTILLLVAPYRRRDSGARRQQRRRGFLVRWMHPYHHRRRPCHHHCNHNSNHRNPLLCGKSLRLPTKRFRQSLPRLAPSRTVRIIPTTTKRDSHNHNLCLVRQQQQQQHQQQQQQQQLLLRLRRLYHWYALKLVSFPHPRRCERLLWHRQQEHHQHHQRHHHHPSFPTTTTRPCHPIRLRDSICVVICATRC